MRDHVIHNYPAGRYQLYGCPNVSGASSVRRRYGDFFSPDFIEGHPDVRSRIGRSEKQDGSAAFHGSESLLYRRLCARAHDNEVG